MNTSSNNVNFKLIFYNLNSFVQHQYNELENYERYINYTLFDSKMDTNIYNSKSIESKEGLSSDMSGIIIQTSVFNHFIGANIAFIGVNQKGKFYQPSINLLPKTNLRPMYQFNMTPSNFHSMQVYKKAIVAFSYHLEFGHFLQDELCAIISMPSSVFEGAEIFVRSRFTNTVFRYFDLCGFDLDHVHILPINWIYANDLYIIAPLNGLNSLQVAWRDLRSLIYKKNNLSHIIAENHVFINKHPNEWGYITNMHDIYVTCLEEYKNYKWLYIKHPSIYLLLDLVKILASTKILLSTSGSIAFNDLFLPPKSGVYMFSPNYKDNPAFLTAYALDLSMLVVGTHTIKFGAFEKGGPFPHHLFKYSFPILLTRVYNHSWPKMIKNVAKCFINSTEIYEKNCLKLENIKSNVSLNFSSIRDINLWMAK